MQDSNRSDRLAEKHEQNQEEQFAGIRRWVKYIQEQPPEVWGTQQNRLVNSQLESARQTELSAEHEQRVQAFAASVSEKSATGTAESGNRPDN